MARGDRHKCKCCQKLFRPDPCTRRDQRYCSAPRCRRTSKVRQPSSSAQRARLRGARHARSKHCGVARAPARRNRPTRYRALEARPSRLRGERDHCKMVAIPTLADEDAKRPNRERESLVVEQSGKVNRIKAALTKLGIRNFNPPRRRPIASKTCVELFFVPIEGFRASRVVEGLACTG
jgi:hypothetical protein